MSERCVAVDLSQRRVHCSGFCECESELILKAAARNGDKLCVKAFPLHVSAAGSCRASTVSDELALGTAAVQRAAASSQSRLRSSCIELLLQLANRPWPPARATCKSLLLLLLPLLFTSSSRPLLLLLIIKSITRFCNLLLLLLLPCVPVRPLQITNRVRRSASHRTSVYACC